MNGRITIDRAGRIVIPKPIREELHLKPGDPLELECFDERITLRPVRAQARLRKEQGVWVYQGEPTGLSITDLIDRERERRIREISR